MIYVDRNAVPRPKDLDGEDSLGGQERQATLEFFACRDNWEKPYLYKAYKAPTVIQALEKLFQGKCAYCESVYQHLQPADIEHFRPKGAVLVPDPVTGELRLQRPGYYWLAATWENLLPSCTDCNRRRKRTFKDGSRGVSGKANSFPISNKKWTLAEGCEKREKPLLLNPCEEDPSQHLEFTDDGGIRPAVSARGRNSDKGEVSIKILGLHRRELEERRRTLALDINARILLIKNLTQMKLDYPLDPRFPRLLDAELQWLKARLRGDQEYVGMARQLVRRQLGPVSIGD